LINSSFSWPTPFIGDVRLDPLLDGGSLVDVGCYCVSASRLLAGEPLAVSAQSVTGPTGVEIALVGTMRFESNVLAHFDSGFHLPNRSELEVVGSAASIRVSDPWHGQSPGLELLVDGQPSESIEVGIANSYQLELEHFARAVRGEPSSLLGRDDAFGQAVTISALYSAAESGSVVALPS
jgi:predicted dehydrogenase